MRTAQSKPRERAELFATRRGRVLLGEDLDGTPVTFGGGVDLGETPLEAAKREYLEEGGYDVENVSPLPIPPVVHPGKGGQPQRTHFFKGEITGRRKKPVDPHPMGKGSFRSPRLAAKKLDWSSDEIHKARQKALKILDQDRGMRKTSMATEGWLDGFWEALSGGDN